MWITPATRHVMCLLSGDHASCGLCQQCIMQYYHCLMICVLYNFCYVMTTLCISYCDVALCIALMSEWKWLRFCVAGNHISFCQMLCLFLCMGILLRVCLLGLCVHVCVRVSSCVSAQFISMFVCVCLCVCVCVLIRLYLSLSVCTCRPSLLNK